MCGITNRLPILLILILGGSSSPLFDSLNCLDDSVGDDCYHTFDEVIADIGIFGQSIHALAEKSNSGIDDPFDLEHDTPAPTKKLTLNVLEKAVKEQTGFVESPIGYLTNYGYVKGVLRAFTSCAGSEDVVHSDEIYASMVTFLSAQRTVEQQAWETMNRTRCSDPDITFDEDGNLDEQSAEIVLNALEGSDAVKERIGEFTKSIEEKRRKKRDANPSPRLDLSEKSEYTYNLLNQVSGMPFAQDSIDLAFESWSNAIGSAVTFTRTASENPDVNMQFVADEHEDWTFSGAELAHAPFPNTEWHGNVHYRQNRNWDIDSPASVDFTYVTVHELGHYLGLKHSSVDGSVMQAIMDSTTIPDEYAGKLADSDILAVKLLYAGAGSTNCPDDWHMFDGVCYIAETVSAGVTWDEAQANCEKHGANLTTVRNGPLNHHILTTVANGRSPYWIGRKSSETGWVDGQSFDWFPEINNRKQMAPSTTKCLRTIAYSNNPKWEFSNCNSKRVKTEHYVCQKNEDDFEPEPTLPPTTEARTSPDRTELPTFTPCQNYVRGAIRRGNFLYIFGNNKYFKYYHTNSRPTLQLGYPKDITENFEGIPSSFTAVVTNPYDRDIIYFIDDQEVYEWQVKGKRSTIEDGKLKKRGRSGYKPKKLKSLFKTTNIIRGATVFDRNSIMLFARGEVGRWYRKTIDKKMVSRYDTVEKWDYLDSMGSGAIDAVSESHFDKFVMFIRDDRYFLVRKSDGKIPRKFIRNLSSDFDKLEICDVIAPFITEYPDDIDPDQALLEEDQ